MPGPDPERKSYGSFASFSDPDGNEWLLQEVTTRLPGRVDEPDVATLAGLLLETAEHHDRFEKAAPAHDWWDWYAPYLTRASTAAPRSRPPPPPTSTWRRRAVWWFPDEVAHLDARELVSRASDRCR